ncbi:MAG: hypothetical protein ACFCAD_12720 [Pleurocapsa sp.]
MTPRQREQSPSARAKLWEDVGVFQGLTQVNALHEITNVENQIDKSLIQFNY